MGSRSTYIRVIKSCVTAQQDSQLLAANAGCLGSFGVVVECFVWCARLVGPIASSARAQVKVSRLFNHRGLVA